MVSEKSERSMLVSASIYGVVISSSVAISIANLAGSLRVLDITGSAAMLSVVVSLYNIAYTFMSWSWTRIFFGRLSRRGIILVSMSGISAGLMAMAFGPTFWIVALGSVLVGLFAAVISPLLTTLLTDYLGHDAAAVTRYNVFSSVGLSLGYLIGAFLRPYVGTDLILWLTAVAILLLMPLAYLIPHKYVVIEPRRVTYVSLIPQFTGRLRPLPSILFSPEIIYNFRDLFRDLQWMIRKKLARRLPLTLIATGILFTGISVFFTPIPALLRHLGLNDTEVYLLYMYSTIVSTVSYAAVHRQVKKAVQAWRPLIISTAARTIIFASFIPVIFAELPESEIIIAVGGIFTAIGITWAYISTTLPTIVLSMSETEKRDERLGHLNAAIGAGTILGSAISGLMYQLLQYEGVLATSSVLVFIASALYIKAQKTLIT
jgi:MFS family permease